LQIILGKVRGAGLTVDYLQVDEPVTSAAVTPRSLPRKIPEDCAGFGESIVYQWFVHSWTVSGYLERYGAIPHFLGEEA